VSRHKDRERLISSMAVAGNGRVKASEVAKALGVGFGAALQILNEIPDLRKCSNNEYRVS
jgi:hypothetical protein